MADFLTKSPSRKNGFMPLRRSPLRNSANAETLEKSISESSIINNSNNEFEYLSNDNLMKNKARSFPQHNKKNPKVEYEIFSWEIDQRSKKFNGKVYSFDTCWECDKLLKISKKRKKLLALKCQCPGIKLFCSRYCRYMHWLMSEPKMCSKTSKSKINEELTKKDIKEFNKVTKYLKSINSLESIDF
tara:strand:- start:486 stop:1046 length:561 start_codon:yes stop_codon:yes gene_type:complete